MPYKGSPANKADKARWQREWRKRNREKARRAWKEWELKSGHNAEKTGRASHLRIEYGITQEYYDELFEKQGGLCAICGTPPNEKYFVIDHCHETGKIRGLLHRTCNAAIGHLNDDPALIYRAWRYLQDALEI